MPTMLQFSKAMSRVLRGSAMPLITKVQIAAHLYAKQELGHRKLASDLQNILVQQDFSWPWFDECHANFIKLKKWPGHPPAWSWFEPTDEVLTEKDQAKLVVKRADAKRILLIASIAHCAWMLYRFDQVCDLISSTSRRRVSLDVEGADPIAKKLAKTWIFDPSCSENLPPFFPGDCTGIHALR